MARYILKRLFAGILTSVVLITVAFFMMHAMSGSPFNPAEERNVPPEVLERIAASYGLDKPVFEQYIDYWKNLLHGNLGISYKKLDTSRLKAAQQGSRSSRRHSTPSTQHTAKVNASRVSGVKRSFSKLPMPSIIR